MKSIKYTFLFLLISLSATAFAKKDGKAHLQGVIKGYQQGSLVTITDPQGNIADDTLKVDNNGKFATAIPVTGPTELLFTIEQPQAFFKIYATPNGSGKMDIAVTQQQGRDNDVKVTYEGTNKELFDYIQTHDFNNVVAGKYTIDTMKQLGFSKYKEAVRADVDNLKATLDPLKDKQFKLIKEAEWERRFTTMMTNYLEAEGPDKEEADYTAWWKEQDFDNNLDLALAGMERAYKHYAMSGNNNYEVDFIRDMPRVFSNLKTFYACANQHILKVMAKAPVNTDQIFAAYKRLYAGHERDIPDYVLASYEEAKNNVAGKPAPDFEMEDENGNTVKLSDLKGKVLYIDIWATWCAPCKAEIPNMLTLSEHYANDANIQLVSISIDQDTERWKNALVKMTKRGNWLQYHVQGALDSDFCKRYNVVGIPRFLLIDREGKVVSLDAPRPGEPKAIELIDQQ